MTGWRIGYTAGPKALVEAINKLQSQMTSNITSFCMPAIVEAYTNPAGAGEIEKMRCEFERRGEHMWKRLNAIPGVFCVRPTGAFYCFPSIAAYLNKPLGAKKTVCPEAVAFSTAVLEEAHVALVPGNDLRLPRPTSASPSPPPCPTSTKASTASKISSKAPDSTTASITALPFEPPF